MAVRLAGNEEAGASASTVGALCATHTHAVRRRTVPGMRPNIFPALHYRDPEAALQWLKRAFGFQEKAVYRGEDGRIQHAELRLGDGLVMFGGVPADGGRPDGAQPPVTIYAVVSDPDGHYEHARAAGAEVVRPLTDQPYGSREYSARDPEGNLWSFGTYDPYDAD